VFSNLEPVPIHTPIATDRTVGIFSKTTRTPFEHVCLFIKLVSP
jgi:hypothetical protein